jgi:hypothetical protein
MLKSFGLIDIGEAKLRLFDPGFPENDVLVKLCENLARCNENSDWGANRGLLTRKPSVS